MLPPGHSYLSLAGSLLWVTISRPDVSVAVSIVCSKSVSPTKADWNAALRVLRYLLSTPDRVLTFVPPSPKVPAVAAYVDAAWANAPRSRSRYGLIVCVYGCPVLWITKLTSIVCLNLFVRPIISRSPTYPHVQLSRAPQLICAPKYLCAPQLIRAPTYLVHIEQVFF